MRKRVAIKDYDRRGASAIPTQRERTGICFYCHEPISAQQPGGTGVSHTDGRPYDGLCAMKKENLK